MILACGLCGGVIETAVAGGGAVAASILLSELYIRLVSPKKTAKDDRCSPPTGDLEEDHDGYSHAQK